FGSCFQALNGSSARAVVSPGLSNEIPMRRITVRVLMRNTSKLLGQSFGTAQLAATYHALKVSRSQVSTTHKAHDLPNLSLQAKAGQVHATIGDISCVIAIEVL